MPLSLLENHAWSPLVLLGDKHVRLPVPVERNCHLSRPSSQITLFINDLLGRGGFYGKFREKNLLFYFQNDRFGRPVLTFGKRRFC